MSFKTRMRFDLRHHLDTEYPVYKERWSIYPSEDAYMEELRGWLTKDYLFLELIKPFTNCPRNISAHGYNVHNNIHDAFAMMLALEAFHYMDANV